MKYYLAPMEGITGFIYRNSYEKFFGGISKYFAPFIVPNKSKSLKTKELRDLLGENNKGINLVPQILTNDSEGFLLTVEKLKELGYSEINLNLGCPSGTVVGKGRGSGFLAHREELNRFLEDIFKIEGVKLSVKTRLGVEDPLEFYKLIEIYNQYPMEELIIHPRTRKDFYGNKPNLEVFKDALSLSKNKICYNGDIFTLEDNKAFCESFKEVDRIMIGRGILANPALMREILRGEFMKKEELRAFHNEIFENYRKVFKDDKNALFRMKELWGYMIYIFSNHKKYSKDIRKAKDIIEYNQVLTRLFLEEDIVLGQGLFKGE